MLLLKAPLLDSLKIAPKFGLLLLENVKPLEPVKIVGKIK
jgi:hypothetical protein